ncbi:FtsX-like permease family protein [Streptosporangium sp. NPDC004631]
MSGHGERPDGGAGDGARERPGEREGGRARERTDGGTGGRDAGSGTRGRRTSALSAVLRLSLRDARRAGGRSALIVAMIALPVLVITGLLIFLQTMDIDPREQLTADIGAADAGIRTTGVRGVLEQDLQGRNWAASEESSEGSSSARSWTAAEVAALLGPGTRLLPMNEGGVPFRGKDEYGYANGYELDLRDPMTTGRYRLVRGRLPASSQEIAITPGMLERGARLGETLAVTLEERPLRVVGLVEHPHRIDEPQIVGLPGTLLLGEHGNHRTGWLADTAGPVTGALVQRLNAVGLLVESRAVIEGTSAVQGRLHADRLDVNRTAAIGLTGVMIVLEVVLLAGPAFAVGLRRRRRELALIAAQGGSPGHLRAIVLADGVVLGGGAAALGLILGAGLAALSLSLGAGRLLGRVAPLDIPWGPIAIVALLGAGSGLAAAVVPALQAARQDVAAVLGGRRGGVRDRVGRPVLGLVLLGLGVAATLFAVRFDVVWVFAAAVLTQLGLVALTPRLVKGAARLAVRFPLPLRLAARDAARHRGRTASAVAAVMTATAAVVAAGIAGSSNFAENRDAFQSTVPVGTTTISAGDPDDGRWAEFRAAAERALPGVPLIEGAVVRDVAGHPLAVSPRRTPRNRLRVFSTEIPIGDGRLLALVQGRPDPVASAAFASGKAVVFDPSLVRNGRLSLDVNSLGGDREGGSDLVTVPAVVARAADPRQAVAVLPVAALHGAGLKTRPRVLYIDPAAYRPTFQQRAGLEWRLQRVIPQVGLQTESGFDQEIAPQLWLLLGAALVLVLGGTFVATGLAAADMRPDLTTMAAVGAPPGTRRLVVAGQAGLIAGLGVLIGAVAGVVTGIAATWPMTARAGSFGIILTEEGGIPSLPSVPPTVEIPWLFLTAVVIGLPVLAAAVAGTFTRTRTTPTPVRRIG